jgi:hypothetical protein
MLLHALMVTLLALRLLLLQAKITARCWMSMYRQ